jgi:chromate transporter
MIHSREPDSPTAPEPSEPATGAVGAEPTAAAVPERLPALVIGRIFLHIGATAFGGLGPSLALIERELVETRRVLTPEDVAEAAAATRLLPGSALIQVVSILGYRLGGWTGSGLATVACVVPPAAAMLLLAIVYDRVAALSAFRPAAQGLTAAVVGLLLATTYRFARATIRGPLTLGITLCAFGSAAGLGIPAAAVVVAAGLIGIPWLSAQQAGQGRESGQRRSR